MVAMWGEMTAGWSGRLLVDYSVGNWAVKLVDALVAWMVDLLVEK